MDINRNILWARRIRGLTQTEAAARCGMRQSRWSDMERHACDPSRPTADIMSSVLQVPVESLWPHYEQLRKWDTHPGKPAVAIKTQELLLLDITED